MSKRTAGRPAGSRNDNPRPNTATAVIVEAYDTGKCRSAGDVIQRVMIDHGLAVTRQNVCGALNRWRPDWFENFYKNGETK